MESYTESHISGTIPADNNYLGEINGIGHIDCRKGVLQPVDQLDQLIHRSAHTKNAVGGGLGNFCSTVCCVRGNKLTTPVAPVGLK